MKKIIALTALLFSVFAVFAQESEDAIIFNDDGKLLEIMESEPAEPVEPIETITSVANDRWIITYNLGFDYTYAFDMPVYETIPIYQTWQESTQGISLALIDNLGKKGHIIHQTNQLEWRKNKLSFTAFANITLNYIPWFCNTAFHWIPECINAGLACLKISAQIWGWALSDGWILLNILTLFSVPILVSSLCGLAGVVCIIAAPLSVLILAVPMFNIGGSIDYHPWTTNLMDTKLSLGIDIDGYRGMYYAGFIGLFAQAQASLILGNVNLYAQTGYRVDAGNIYTIIKSKEAVNTGTNSDYVSKYVPAPYLRAGLSWSFGNK